MLQKSGTVRHQETVLHALAGRCEKKRTAVREMRAVEEAMPDDEAARKLERNDVIEVLVF